MDQINSEILRQFEQQGLSINEGVAVDARLAKSASRPMSQDELKKQREHRQTEDGKRDKIYPVTNLRETISVDS
jgi:IS5 family transposase